MNIYPTFLLAHQGLYVYTVNPVFNPPVGLFISSPFEGVGGGGGRLIETGGLFNLETTIVSVLHKELEYKVEELKYKKVLGHAAKDQNQIRSSS